MVRAEVVVRLWNGVLGHGRITRIGRPVVGVVRRRVLVTVTVRLVEIVRISGRHGGWCRPGLERGQAIEVEELLWGRRRDSRRDGITTG